MVTGIYLLFDNQYNVGDIIDVEEFHGEVIKIGFRSTTLKDQGGNIKIINNSSMCNITNRSYENSLALCDIRVPAKLNVSVIEDSMRTLVENLKKVNRFSWKYQNIWELNLWMGIRWFSELLHGWMNVMCTTLNV